MQVFVLNIGWDKEGEQTLGVYASRDAAVAAVAALHAACREDCCCELVEEDGRWTPLGIGGISYYVRPFDVFN